MNRSASTPSVAEGLCPTEISSLPYFHPEINNMQQVFSTVQQYINNDGHFLLRKSFTKPGTLTVSVLHGRGVKHFSIASQNGYYFLKDQLFHSVKELVTYYKTHDVPNIEGITHLRLEKPILYWSSSNFEPTNDSRKSSSTKSSRSSAVSDTPTSRKQRSNSLGVHRTNASEYRTMLKTIRDKSAEYAAAGSLNLSSDTTSASSSPMTRQRVNIPKSYPDFDADLYYSAVRNPYEEMVPRLVQALEEMDETYGDRCICGLLIDDADLALGWTMHLSTEPESIGKLFFMGPEGETAWNLPLEVSICLTAEQQEKIQNLLQQI